MIDATTAATIFCICTAVAVVFQLALALGAPWGEMALGGRYPGRFPLRLRIASLAQSVVLVLLSFVVLTRSQLSFEKYFEYSEIAIWFVVGVCALSATMNILTPSKKERLLWGPVTLVMLFCVFIVAKS